MTRIEKVIERMKKEKMDALVINDPSSIDYLIGYKNSPGERMFVLLIDTNNHPVLFMNNLFYLDQKLDMDMVFYSDTDDYVELLADHVKKYNTVGIDKLFPAKFLMPLMAQCEETIFTLGSECVDKVRMIKDEEEIKLMREASRLNDLAIDQVISIVSKGNLSEKEVSAKLPEIWESLGCSGNSFEPIVGYGKNGADNHHSGDDSLIQVGDSCVIDMGGIYKDYCSDMTRTVFYKEVSEEKKTVYNLVLKAQLAAEAIIKPGVKLSTIDKTARDIIKEGGYTKEFNHRLGHFIGRDVHEWGDVSQGFDLEVEEGMIFSIEPGVYLKDHFGVRIEDLVLVTKDGCEVLNHYSKDLLVVGND